MKTVELFPNYRFALIIVLLNQFVFLHLEALLSKMSSFKFILEQSIRISSFPFLINSTAVKLSNILRADMSNLRRHKGL